jgi:hypothetical protein
MPGFDREGFDHMLSSLITHLARLRMEKLIPRTRSASPSQASCQPLDKKPRLAFSQPAVQIGMKHRSKKKKHTTPQPGSSEDVVSREVVALLGEELVARAEADGVEWASPFGFREEVELTVSSISSSGMSYSKVRVVQIPHRWTFYPRLYLHTQILFDIHSFEQAKDSPFPLHPSLLGSSSFPSPCLERSYARVFTGIQGCIPSPT